MKSKEVPLASLTSGNKDVAPILLDESRGPSKKAWESVMHKAVVGNGIFPQAFLAQGIFVANTMSEEANREGIPIQTFLEGNPPRELIDRMIAEARDKSHAAYGIKTNSSGIITTPVQYVWGKDQGHARTVLTNMAEISYENARGASFRGEINDLIQDMQSNPLFQGLLVSAAAGLSLVDVRAQSDLYKQRLVKFMRKYQPYSFIDNQGELGRMYDNDRKKLRNELTRGLSISTAEMKNHMLVWIKQEYPQNHALLASVARLQPTKLFGDPVIAHPHPLKHPDYKLSYSS